jgi:hypothetical protein
MATLEDLKKAVEQQTIRDGADQAVGCEKLPRRRTHRVVDLLVDYLFQDEPSRPDVVWVAQQLQGGDGDARPAARLIFDEVIPRVADTMGFVINQDLSRRLREALDAA